ncbi:ABC transporter permease [Sporosalibacterium faouarense]|uniref:ABC transporter permease n=1 Tax=Sporosalibacterium faouarense TaxID=516123 RepID=UPI00141D0E6B|nr:ABC transporter permease [Sporosalibacterium faouarense]MTI46702.1 ABC transporter permease [Bacillota bacterium]
MAELNKEKFQTVGKDLAQSQSISRPSITYWKDAWRRLKENKVAMVAMVVLILLAIMAFAGPAMRPFDYKTGDILDFNQKPGSLHWFGTDDIGRDLWVRVWRGARLSLFIGLTVAIANIVLGILYGGVSGYIGGRTDLIMMRICEILGSIPYLIRVIMIMVILGSGVGTVILAMTVAGWVGTARMIRGQVLQLKEMEFVMAAKTLGADTSRIILKHLVPNTMGILIVNLTFRIPSAIFGEAFLGYIGMGVEPPEPSLGILSQKGTNMILIEPYQLASPAIVISLLMLAFTMLGEGLRDALDPRLRK